MPESVKAILNAALAGLALTVSVVVVLPTSFIGAGLALGLKALSDTLEAFDDWLGLVACERIPRLVSIMRDVLDVRGLAHEDDKVERICKRLHAKRGVAISLGRTCELCGGMHGPRSVQAAPPPWRESASGGIGGSSTAHHQVVSKAVSGWQLLLGEKPDSTDFGNGDGFVQHDRAFVQALTRTALALVGPLARVESPKTIDRAMWELDQINSKPAEDLYRFLFRLECIDARGREWGQPYYAQNPQDPLRREWCRLDRSELEGGLGRDLRGPVERSA